ncbi:MAG: hypothetical protein ACKVRP_02970 [Bacteroidota bacterium]
MKKPKRPRDSNQLAANIVALATGQVAEQLPEYNTKNQHAVALGRLGGLKGGKARAKALSPAQRTKIAKLAAKKRWSKRKKP